MLISWYKLRVYLRFNNFIIVSEKWCFKANQEDVVARHPSSRLLYRHRGLHHRPCCPHWSWGRRAWSPRQCSYNCPSRSAPKTDTSAWTIGLPLWGHHFPIARGSARRIRTHFPSRPRCSTWTRCDRSDWTPWCAVTDRPGRNPKWTYSPHPYSWSSLY